MVDLQLRYDIHRNVCLGVLVALSPGRARPVRALDGLVERWLDWSCGACGWQLGSEFGDKLGGEPARDVP